MGSQCIVSAVPPTVVPCGCSAVVLAGYLLRQMEAGKLKNLLFCGTGALHSPTATMQGESIPGICHAVAITTEKKGGAQ